MCQVISPYKPRYWCHAPHVHYQSLLPETTWARIRTTTGLLAHKSPAPPKKSKSLSWMKFTKLQKVHKEIQHSAPTSLPPSTPSHNPAVCLPIGPSPLNNVHSFIDPPHTFLQHPTPHPSSPSTVPPLQTHRGPLLSEIRSRKGVRCHGRRRKPAKNFKSRFEGLSQPPGKMVGVGPWEPETTCAVATSHHALARYEMFIYQQSKATLLLFPFLVTRCCD